MLIRSIYTLSAGRSVQAAAIYVSEPSSFNLLAVLPTFFDRPSYDEAAPMCVHVGRASEYDRGLANAAVEEESNMAYMSLHYLQP